MFTNFKNATESVPQWASFFEQEEYRTFLSALDHYFHSIHLDYVLGDGLVHFPNNPLQVNYAGLSNVAQTCKQVDPGNYPEIIAAHFDAMFKADRFDENFKTMQGDFEQVKDYIGVRIQDVALASQAGKDAVLGKELVGGLYLMIVLDLPDSVASITPEQALNWNKTLEELTEMGVANMQAKYEFRIAKMPLGDQSQWFVTGDHFFTANILFDLKNRPEMIGTHGSLVSFPNRHAAMIYPIESIEVLNAIGELFPLILGLHEQGPGSLSDQLFWYKDGELIVLSYDIVDNQLNFNPPQSFIELLHTLQA